ncbi:hypothetical protein L525_4956 [Bordetella bronchiseptica MBORD782]|nr:hypothetical protein L525_4956 [Bordetella bronchiseptica MBORD782]
MCRRGRAVCAGSATKRQAGKRERCAPRCGGTRGRHDRNRRQVEIRSILGMDNNGSQYTSPRCGVARSAFVAGKGAAASRMHNPPCGGLCIASAPGGTRPGVRLPWRRSPA